MCFAMCGASGAIDQELCRQPFGSGSAEDVTRVLAARVRYQASRGEWFCTVVVAVLLTVWQSQLAENLSNFRAINGLLQDAFGSIQVGSHHSRPWLRFCWLTAPFTADHQAR